ncbi:related to 7-aminocholesterol resistance protein [Cephalotrichum gorgonifer]|uniref:Related to 7-aminocholesterol resistance protein n=1 Tax=Cephalotrichum gorgonifer TaxID=2041049 RepID=A0AAE8SST1_9PEZI|nr:related to 7-aminocholesterol resistance protein [Cephalotrichum gorgonifer]
MPTVSYDAEGPPFGPIVNGTQIVFYHYRPNQEAAWGFVVLFGLAAAGHVFFFFKLRAWHFLPLVLGVIGQVFGYYARVMAHKNPNIAGPFIMQNLLILGMAPLIAATVYMSLSRIINALDLRDQMFISPKLTTVFYIIVDIGCFVTQVFGSVMPASGDPDGIALGRNLVIGGLIAQLAALSLFLFSTFHAQLRARRSTTKYAENSTLLNGSKYFITTYAITSLMTVRALIRAIEYLQGADGYIMAHEAFLYVFDAAPMVCIPALYIVIHPGRLVRDASKMERGIELHG